MLAERLSVSVRTVRADVDRLRTLDYTIDATPGVDGGYRLRAGTRLPPLPLDDDGAVAVAVAVALRTATTAGVTGLGEHATRAAAKLEQLLPARLRPRLTTVRVVAEAAPSTVTRYHPRCSRLWPPRPSVTSSCGSTTAIVTTAPPAAGSNRTGWSTSVDAGIWSTSTAPTGVATACTGSLR